MPPALSIRPATTEAELRAFSDINRAWLKKFFVVEAEDERILSDPRRFILEPGGLILLARIEGEISGAAALIAIPEGDFEFAKMGVHERFQGRGIGRQLLEAAAAEARQRGAKKLLICTSSTLEKANRLYRNFGFRASTDPRHHAYARADVFLEYRV